MTRGAAVIAAMACAVVTSGGCKENQYPYCLEPGEFEFSLEWEPDPGLSVATSPGVVQEVVEDPAGTLAVTMEITSGEHEPGSYVFRVPLPAGVEVDLAAGDEVTVTTHDLRICYGCSIMELSIERDGVPILYALDCDNELCNESSFDVGPLSFEVAGDVCPPWKYPSGVPSEWCFIKEDLGLDVSCPGTGGAEQAARVFEGHSASLECNDGRYLVSAGTQVRVIGYPEDIVCMDYPTDQRQLLVIRGK